MQATPGYVAGHCLDLSETAQFMRELRRERAHQIEAKAEDGLVDLDSTVADYETSMSEEMRKLQAPEEAPYKPRFSTTDRELPYMEARRKLIQARAGFWLNLKPLKPGFEIVDLMRAIGFRLHVLTKGPEKTPTAWSEKLLWSQQWLADAAVTVTSDKSKFYGRVLADDFPDYFVPWLKRRPRGLVVCVAQTWNADFAIGAARFNPQVFRYTGGSLDEMKALAKALIQAHDRQQD